FVYRLQRAHFPRRYHLAVRPVDEHQAIGGFFVADIGVALLVELIGLETLRQQARDAFLVGFAAHEEAIGGPNADDQTDGEDDSERAHDVQAYAPQLSAGLQEVKEARWCRSLRSCGMSWLLDLDSNQGPAD